MVMAGNESAPDDALSARLQWLRQRREALQEKLAQKNNELKNLCVEEAEITGVLPPEIPLEPGESPPTFRRKVATSFTYPQKLINKLKSTDVEESELELERQVQLGIVETALGIINDPTESKATRRKNRLVYQQSQRRLQELETELNFIRQSRGKTHRPVQLPTQVGSYNTQSHSHTNVKHRTKKPRPPLDNSGNEVSTPKSAGRGILHDPGISLSPLVSDDKCIIDKLNTYPGHGYEDQLIPNVCSHHHHSGTHPSVSPIDQTNVKIVEHDHNDNHNIYILPEQYRPRTYSHGSGGSRSQSYYQDNERTYRPYVPNTYTEDERLMRYRQLQHAQKQQQLQDHIQSHRLQHTSSVEYKHPYNLDNADIRRSQGSFDKDFRASHYTPVTDYQVYYKNNAQSQQSLHRRDRDNSSLSGSKNTLRHTSSSTLIEAQLMSGYWVRHNDEVHWVSLDDPAADRFGSLDRRRRNTQPNGGVAIANSDAQSRYRTVAVSSTKNSSGSNVATSSHQHHSVHLLPLSEHQIPNNKMLLRTQSLGSVEMWQSSHSHDSHDSKDAPTEYTNNNRKSRQKEWYETSLDSGAPASFNHNVATAPKNAHYQSSPPPPRIKIANTESVRESQITSGPPPISPVNRHKRDKPEERQHAIQAIQPHVRYEPPATRPKILEIPAESKPALDVCDDAIRPLGSPQNCTVVQPGKYQPYREVTKPFEMSDFYKYSTKFRKRNEVAAQSQVGSDSPLQENRPVEVGSGDLSRDPNCNFGQSSGNITASPVQRRFYQPVQRMTCQPYLSSLR